MFEGMNEEEKEQFMMLTRSLDSSDFEQLEKLIDEFGSRVFREGIGAGRG